MQSFLREARAAFKNVMVYFDMSYNGDGGSCRLVNIKTGEFLGHSAFTDEFLRLYRHKWSITMMVAHRAPHSIRHDLSDSHVDIKQEIKQVEVADFLNDEHQALYKSINENHISNIMWLGSPIGQSIECEKELHKLIDKLGGFESKPKWELA